MILNCDSTYKLADKLYKKYYSIRKQQRKFDLLCAFKKFTPMQRINYLMLAANAYPKIKEYAK